MGLDYTSTDMTHVTHPDTGEVVPEGATSTPIEPNAAGSNWFEEKQERRRARLARAAERQREEAAARFTTADAVVAGIPFGQPILVGHHSEKRHRAALDKMARNMTKGCEAMDEARELDRRAEAVGTAGISSDDPAAVEKLDDKVETLEARREAMKRVNKYFKTHGIVEGCGESAEIVDKALRYLQHCGAPFPSFALSNLGARIRDAKKRAATVAEVQHMAATQAPAAEPLPGGATVTQAYPDMRTVLRFSARLSRPHYKYVRSAGFVWSPTVEGFVRKLSLSALYAARAVAARIAAELTQTQA